VRLEELGQLKNPMTSSGVEPATFLLVAQCLNQMNKKERKETQIKVYKIMAIPALKRGH
jgi:hypothetical protein